MAPPNHCFCGHHPRPRHFLCEYSAVLPFNIPGPAYMHTSIKSLEAVCHHWHETPPHSLPKATSVHRPQIPNLHLPTRNTQTPGEPPRPRTNAHLESLPSFHGSRNESEDAALPTGQTPHLPREDTTIAPLSKERATVEADIDPQEGPTSLQYLQDELALIPGTQLSIDPDLVPPLHVLHNSAKWNE